MISISNLKENIYSIAIGLRFNPTFAIGDNLGKIADKILYSKNSYFDPKFFPFIDSGINEILLKDAIPTRHLYISVMTPISQGVFKLEPHLGYLGFG